jgi:ribosomal subunit interface protein
LEIHWVHVEGISEQQRAVTEDRLRRLAGEQDDLIDVRIAGRKSGHHRHGDQEIHIACQARGKEIVASRTRADLGMALDEALDAFEREVHELRRRRRDRREARPPEPPHLGIVDRVFREQGYGFVITDAGERVYFHRNAVNLGLNFETLEEGQRVGLNFEPGDKGLQATALVAAPPDAPSP